MRAALRQAPKVILVGEMRDRETVEIGLSAAETGHLVLTTLHTVDAGQTINRILGMFSTEEENQIRIRLGDTVRWIICQRLLPKVGGGRVAAFEILATNLRVHDAVLHGESEGKTFYDIMQAGKAFGMTTFDDFIISLFERGLISEETALAYASRRGIVGRGVDSVKAARAKPPPTLKTLRWTPSTENHRHVDLTVLFRPAHPKKEPLRAMEITCEKCQAKFKIADEKIPAGRTVAIKCPKCREKIAIASPDPADEKSTVLSSVHGFEESGSEAYDAADRPFDFVEEEGKTALICETDPGINDKIMATLNFMDYRITEAESSRDALKKMRYHVYDMILINEEFDTRDADANGILIYLERLNINVRRNVFVVLLTKRFRTLDNMMAFIKSVNMILNISNIDDFDKILRRGIADNDYFYRTFREGLHKVGKI